MVSFVLICLHCTSQKRTDRDRDALDFCLWPSCGFASILYIKQPGRGIVGLDLCEGNPIFLLIWTLFPSNKQVYVMSYLINNSCMLFYGRQYFPNSQTGKCCPQPKHWWQRDTCCQDIYSDQPCGGHKMISHTRIAFLLTFAFASQQGVGRCIGEASPDAGVKC